MGDVLTVQYDALKQRVEKLEEKLETYHDIASPTTLQAMKNSIEGLNRTVWMASGILVVFQVVFVPILIKLIAG